MVFSRSTQQNFTIVFLRERDATELKIPPHFCVELRTSVTLRDKYKNIWQVKARKVNGRWYLLDGWAKFVTDNSVTFMDELSFRYSGPGLLDVNILRKSGGVRGFGYHRIDNRKVHQKKESVESDGIDMFERLSYGKNNILESNGIKDKGKMGKEVSKYQDYTDEYETDDDFVQHKGYWDGEGDDESDEFEMAYQENAKFQENAQELRKFRNGNYASCSRKPHQRKRKVDFPDQGILRFGQASKNKNSYYMKRMKPLHINESKKGNNMWNKESEDEEEDDSDNVSIDFTPRNDQMGKGRVEKEFRADGKTYTANCSKRRNDDNMCGNEVSKSRLAQRRKFSSSHAKMSLLQINEMDNKGKGILSESSDINSYSSGWAYDSYEETSEEDLRNKKKLKSKVIDVKAPKSSILRKRVRVHYLGKEILKSAGMPRPKRKYFVTKPKLRRMNECYIPKNILMDLSLWLPKKIKLVDPNGKTYTSWLVSWTDGRAFYKGGWNRLSKRNQLTPNDYCVCEFGEGDQKRYLYVSFIRPSDE